MLEPVEHGRLEVRFSVGGMFLQIQEFQDTGAFDGVSRLRQGVSLHRQAQDFLFVAAEGQSFVDGCIDLTLEVPYAPIAGVSFDLVESTLRGIFESHENEVMGPAQGKLEREVVQGGGGQWMPRT